MALHTKKEFADLCGLPTKNLSVYISRGKVVVGADDLIDDTNPVNVLFLGTRKTAAAPAGKKKPAKEKPAAAGKKAKDKPAPPPAANKLLEIEEQRKKLELQIAEHKLNKMAGALIPTDQVKMLFSQHFKSVFMSFESCFDNLLQNIAQKTKMSSKDVARYRSELIKEMNSAMEKAIHNTKKNITSLVDEYTEVRGRGEKRGL